MTLLFDAVGGSEGLQRLSAAFYRRVLTDDLLAPVFANFTPQHTEHVAVWLAEVFGGPAEYTGLLNGHQGLLRAHLGLHIRDEHRTRWLELMNESVREVYPESEETGRVLMDYFRWGTAIAQSVSQEPADADLGDPGPTPRWGTGGLM